MMNIEDWYPGEISIILIEFIKSFAEDYGSPEGMKHIHNIADRDIENLTDEEKMSIKKSTDCIINFLYRKGFVKMPDISEIKRIYCENCAIDECDEAHEYLNCNYAKLAAEDIMEFLAGNDELGCDCGGIYSVNDSVWENRKWCCKCNEEYMDICDE